MIHVKFKEHGQFIEYSILPEHRKVRIVVIKTKEEFDFVLKKYSGKKLNVDFNKLKSDNDSNYAFTLARISFVTIYLLSNGLFAIDQLINSKASPYYICESLTDFKFITKYLLIYRTELDWDFEVECSIFEHFEIKEFLKREKEHLKLNTEMSTDRHRLYIAEDGKCVYISYWGNMKDGNNAAIGLNTLDGRYTYKDIENEDEFYWSLVIYESMEKFKLHKTSF